MTKNTYRDEGIAHSILARDESAHEKKNAIGKRERERKKIKYEK